MIEEQISLINHAARKSDRWWFFALLLIGMTFIGFLIHWGQDELAKRDSRIEALEERYTNYLVTTNAQLTQALTENSKVIEANSRLLDRVEAHLK